MKNFKKVISAVIALAMAVSSFSVVSASKFTDVADTANYAEAVEVLASLGIVNGIEEEGTLVFKPENTITRAEATTMIVGALNMTDDAKASAGTSRFEDVNSQASWAAGYVNVGVAQGFIAGYDATSFGPTDNVTYEQLCVMLTKIAGYGEYAAASGTGHWSSGYTTMAASVGINKGVAVANDAALTRAQVAQMIYNTLVTPVLGVAEYSLTGNTYSQLDGKNDREFKTLLSDKFDGYVATVRITDTPATQDSFESDDVAFTVTKADYWPETEEAVTSSDDHDTAALFAANVDVVNNHLQTGKAVFVENDDDELVMIYFAPTGKTTTKEVAADDYVLQSDLSTNNKYSATGKIKFGNTSYKMEEKFNLYVNGVKYADELEAEADTDALLDRLFATAPGSIKLIKDGDAKNYTDIFVEYYEVAKVTAVTYKNDEVVINMTTKNALDTDYNKIVITDENVEEGKVLVSVMRNGAEAELSSIVKGDIIAYATDFTKTNKTIEDPKSIKILATNEMATGKVTSVDEDERIHVIDGKEYHSVLFDVDFPEIKNSYELTLDPFGRIYDAELAGVSEKYGILIKTTSSGTAQLVLGDGTTKTYDLSDKAEKDLKAAGIDDNNDVRPLTVEKRIVAYTLKTSTNEITSIEFVDVDSLGFNEYKARTGKIGSATITESTQVIDAIDAESEAAYTSTNYGAFNTSELKDGVTYDGYFIKVGTYTNFVVITKVGTKYNEEVRFAVVRKAAAPTYTEDGDEVDSVLVLYNGAEEELLFDTNVYAKAGLSVGDVFFFEENSDGFVDTVYTVYKSGKFQTLKVAGVDDSDLPKDNKGWSYNLRGLNDNGTQTDIQLVEGYVVDVTSKSIALTSTTAVAANYIDTALDIDDENGDKQGVAIFGIDADCVAYEYDTDDDIIKEIDRFSAIDAASVKASAFGVFEVPGNKTILAKYYVDEDEQVKQDLDINMDEYANYAIAMIVDGDVVAIYTIVK